MSMSIKLFDFQGIPVYLRLWFFLLLFLLTPVQVLIVFISILIHELAHAWMANRKGYKVYQISIDMLSGAAEMDINQIPERDSIPIIFAGPLSNLILSLFSFSLLSIFPENDFLIQSILINFLIFAFNILPIYPMDGGRILRDFLVVKMRSNRAGAKNISAWISLIFSVSLLIFSIYTVSFFTGVFSALFIYYAVKDLGWINK